MSNRKQMFKDAIQDTLSELYCMHHPNESLQYAEITVTKFVSWSDVPIKVYHDIEYCPKCFEKHETGKEFKHDIKSKPLFTNIKRSNNARHEKA